MNLKILTATAGNAVGDTAPFRQVSGSTEPLNDLASVARSRPRKSDSVSSPYLVGNHVCLFGNLFCQIIPLSIWYTPTLGTILSLQAPSFYTPGAFGLQSHTASNHIVRAGEAVTVPILSVGHSVGVVQRVYGRTLGFFQHPRS